MHSLGFKIRCKPDGALIVDGIVEGKPSDHGYVSYLAYYNKWKREYPQLKVSRPAEDICNHCFVFANRHRYLANHSTTETATVTTATTATMTEATTTPTANNNADDGNTAAAATMTMANTTVAATPMKATNDNGDTTVAATRRVPIMWRR